MGRTFDQHLHYAFGPEVDNYSAIQKWLSFDEEVKAMFQGGENICVFTNKRIILKGASVNESGKLIGKEVYSTSIPYRNISMFSHEISDTTLFNTFKHIDIWLISGQIVSLLFPKNTDFASIKKALRENAL